MNKKIFAALASATMALSATGSLAVFAEDFDVVDEAGNNGTGAGVNTPNSEVKVNIENFPDDAFREALLGNTTATTKFYSDDACTKLVTMDPISYGKGIATSKLDTIKGIVLGDKVADTTGIEYFKNLETLKTENAANAASAVETVDLTDNVKLETLSLLNAQDLATLVLPETNTLSVVLINGNSTSANADGSVNYTANTYLRPATSAPITTIDFSGNKGLTTVVINATDVMKLDLSNNTHLQNVNVAGNKLFSLDLTNNFDMMSVSAFANNLYSIDVPNTPKTTYLNVSYNILQEIDLTGLSGIQTLYLNNNELKSVDLSPVADTATTVTVNSNHIGALDDQGITGITLNPQIVYVDSSFNGVNLKETFEDFDGSDVTYIGTTAAADSKDYNKKTGILDLNNDTTQYTYNTGKNNMDVTVLKNVSVMNRLYNPNSGEHFYTHDVKEKDTLVGLGWHDEGTGWVSPKESNAPVYRLYNPNAGDHHYTMSSTERDILVSVGWKNEGTGWYSYKGGKDYIVSGYGVINNNDYNTIENVSVVREYNPNAKAAGAHNYTIDRAENDFLVSIGWLDEGIAWQSLK